MYSRFVLIEIIYQLIGFLLQSLPYGVFCFQYVLIVLITCQVFCVGLWCLDEYWYYSLFTLFMLFMFESTMAKSRLKTLSELRRVRVDTQTLMVYRCGKYVNTRIAPYSILFFTFTAILKSIGMHVLCLSVKRCSW